MNDLLVKKFDTGKIIQGSAIMKIKNFNPKNLIVQHLTVRGCEKKIEINHLGNGYIMDTFHRVDIQEIGKIGGKVIQIYGGVIHRENFEVSPFRKLIDKLFVLRQKYKDEKNEGIQLLVKLLLNSLDREQMRKKIEKNSLLNQNSGWWVNLMKN